MKFSEIQKKGSGEPVAPAETPTPLERIGGPFSFKPPKPPPEAPRAAPAPAPVKRAPPAEPALSLGTLEAQRAAARAAYGRAIQAATRLFAAPGSQEPGMLAELAAVSEELLELLSSGNVSLLAFTCCSTPEDPDVGHCVNVAILALKLGLSRKLGRDDLSVLGVAALIHDLGRLRSYRLVLPPAPRALEANKIREALRQSARRVEAFGDADAAVAAELAGVLSRLHGAGAGPDARSAIISVCDLYDALTHAYDGAPAKHPSDALRELISLKADSDRALVKAFLEDLSPYPPGSLIELSDGRIGCVVAVNSRFLTRPVVEIWLRADGVLQDPPLIVDLAREPIAAVTRPPDESKLALSAAAARMSALRRWSE